jgi:hypothetical protein
MRRPTFIPESVKKSIQSHIRKAIAKARHLHKSGQEEEDALTGHLGAFLTTQRTRRVRVDGRTWTWSIGYSKLRGRGPGATEKVIGADGIIEFSIRDIEQNFIKSALFQAKRDNQSLQRLFAQTIALSPFREAAFIIHYGNQSYTAADWGKAFKQSLGLPRPDEVPLDEFLTDSFIGCAIGDSELHYDRDRRILRWRDIEGNVVHVQFPVRHQFQIRIEGPNPLTSYLGQTISPDQIQEHRMEATDDEILGIGRDATTRDVAKARREAASSYHSDKYQRLPASRQQFLDDLLKEINSAADRKLSYLRRK